MKRCQNCNAKMEDNAIFCLACGAAAPEAATTEAVELSETPTPKNSDKLIRIILGVVAVAVLAAIVIIVIPMINSDRTASNVAKSYVQFLNDRDYSEYIALVMPEPIAKVYNEKYQMKPETIFNETTMGIFGNYNQLYGSSWTATFEKTKEISDLKEADFKELKTEYKNQFDMDISAATTIKYTVTFTGDKTETKTISQIIYKCNGKWYILV